MESRRLLAERQRAGTVDDVELRRALFLCEPAEEPQALVDAGQRIVASPDHLTWHLHTLAAAHLVEARLRLHQARHELVFVLPLRHRRLLPGRRYAGIYQFVADVSVGIGHPLERPALRILAPERLRGIGEREVRHPVTGRRG